ncbi:MAG: cysteine desulfurase [Clostridia bacterium]|jgi:cysteine desulfurase|nr:cysteine desulfurase [Clostridia bacterium]MBQ5801551.1 cysteine desulfurase [Clostridia bacterium]
MQAIYLDHAATTKLKPEALSKMLPYFTEVYGNANSQHAFGREAMAAVDEARDFIASAIGAKPSEIYFTSGGTEADNWALKGMVRAAAKKGKHFIISAIEHPAMIESAKALEKEGYECTYLPVLSDGTVNLQALKDSIRPDTTFIGVMLANNEIGTIQPVAEIVNIAKEYRIPVFTDAVQAVPAMRIDVKQLGVSAMAFSSHKFGGPKGVGVLYLKTGTPIAKMMTGGHQERTQRGGTTNVTGIVGMAEALRITLQEMDANNAKIASLRDYFVARVKAEIPEVIYNGSEKNRVPSNANFTFRYIEGESILFRLDLAGIAVSSGSACSSGSLEPSHVLLAIGLREGDAHGTIRFSFGAENTKEEVDYVVDTLKQNVQMLREMSPLYHK